MARRMGGVVRSEWQVQVGEEEEEDLCRRLFGVLLELHLRLGLQRRLELYLVLRLLLSEVQLHQLLRARLLNLLACRSPAECVQVAAHRGSAALSGGSTLARPTEAPTPTVAISPDGSHLRGAVRVGHTCGDAPHRCARFFRRVPACGQGGGGGRQRRPSSR